MREGGQSEEFKTPDTKMSVQDVGSSKGLKRKSLLEIADKNVNKEDVNANGKKRQKTRGPSRSITSESLMDRAVETRFEKENAKANCDMIDKATSPSRPITSQSLMDVDMRNYGSRKKHVYRRYSLSRRNFSFIFPFTVRANMDFESLHRKLTQAIPKLDYIFTNGQVNLSSGISSSFSSLGSARVKSVFSSSLSMKPGRVTESIIGTSKPFCDNSLSLQESSFTQINYTPDTKMSVQDVGSSKGLKRKSLLEIADKNVNKEDVNANGKKRQKTRGPSRSITSESLMDRAVETRFEKENAKANCDMIDKATSPSRPITSQSLMDVDMRNYGSRKKHVYRRYSLSRRNFSFIFPFTVRANLDFESLHRKLTQAIPKLDYIFTNGQVNLSSGISSSFSSLGSARAKSVFSSSLSMKPGRVTESIIGTSKPFCDNSLPLEEFSLILNPD
ncbi:uncharacterized protein [Phyllobates terribilis]|uniref:uncharacterized protein isoform X2 n=1 Tax=Phyllobates terribilis TaxID=111132 RepID=UPI003CCAC3CF